MTKGTILWVDDEPEYLSDCHKVIRDSLNIEIEAASDLHTAILKLANETYLAVIVDIFLPVGNEELLSDNTKEIASKHGDQGGITLIELLVTQTSHNAFQAEQIIEIPIFVISGFIVETLIHHNQIFNSSDIVVIPKSELFLSPEKVSDVLRAGIDFPKNETFEVSEQNQYLDRKKSQSHIDSTLLTQMFARVAHYQSSTWFGINLALAHALEYCGPDPFKEIYNISLYDLKEALFPEIRKIVAQLKKFIEILDGQTTKRKISEKLFYALRESCQVLHDFYNGIGTEQIEAVLDAAQVTREVTMKMRESKVPKQLAKEIAFQAKEIERIYSLYYLHHAHVSLFEMAQQAETISAYMMQKSLQDEALDFFNINDALRDAVRNCYDYAKLKGVEIRMNSAQFFSTHGRVDEVRRAFVHLINNAIKYTHKLPKEKGYPWIIIRTNTFKNSCLIIIENWGEPIDRDEIKSGRIFSEGYRGVLSRRSIPGTGLGLADVKRVVDKHSGSIEVESRPAKRNQADDYKGDYLTTFTVSLPLIPKV